MNEQKLRCPGCGGADIRHSLPRGVLDSIMLAFGRSPFRCRCCERRFYQSTALRSPDRRQQPAGEAPADSKH